MSIQREINYEREENNQIKNLLSVVLYNKDSGSVMVKVNNIIF